MGDTCHDFGFDKVIVGGPPGKDEAWCYAAHVLAHTFGDARQLLWSRIAVGIGWIAEDDDSVETLEGRTGSGRQLASQCRPGEKG